MKALVIFGSGSDEPSFSRISRALAKRMSVETRVASAHRTPELVEKIITGKFDIIVAGAGVAAALPGVVAAGTIRPVFGMPVNSACEALDSFLSIVQMPPGIPVICAPAGEAGIKHFESQAGNIASIAAGKYDGVNIIGDLKNKRISAAIDMLTNTGVPVMVSDSTVADVINIYAFKGTSPKLKSKHFVIAVPIIDKPLAIDALKLCRNSAGHFWTGFNRVDNAAIASIQLLNNIGQFEDAILEMRQNGKAAVIKADKQARMLK